MSFGLLNTKEKTPENREWKEKNKRYLKQLQKFLDVADNIERDDLRKSVISEMLKCDLILTELAEKEIERTIENSQIKN